QDLYWDVHYRNMLELANNLHYAKRLTVPEKEKHEFFNTKMRVYDFVTNRLKSLYIMENPHLHAAEDLFEYKKLKHYFDQPHKIKPIVNAINFYR
ncbi:MAG: hypothetical protein NZZ41_07855, partial [Candidatus Dojkabacteria bacterium]|nr:hypothetical protein [Candidatus Dojkabacteria bacterium]